MSLGRFGGGNGTSDAPYLIEDADDLDAIRKHPSAYFKMMNDINLSNGKYNLGQGWKPISNFTGYLDGNNHKIINLYINRPTENFVGFFVNMYSSIRNIIFVDSEVIGHDYVGTVVGYYTYDSWSETGKPREIQNVSIVNGQIKGQSNVGGLCGIMSSMGVSSYIDDLFIDVTIESADAIAYGIGRMGNAICQANNRIGGSNCSRNGTWNGFWRNCNCNCPNCCSSNWNCDCTPTVSNHHFTYRNCAVHIHKHPSIITYYGISDVYSEYSSCYIDKTEISPIIGTGASYSNLVKVEYSTDILPNLKFRKEYTKSVEPMKLNNDSIYFHLTDGYYVYDFDKNEFVRKYVKFANENSKQIIQNGMSKESLQKIPSEAMKYLSDNFTSIKVVNCLNAHDKIVYKKETLDFKKFKETNNTKIFKKKIDFNKTNDNVVEIVR